MMSINLLRDYDAPRVRKSGPRVSSMSRYIARLRDENRLARLADASGPMRGCCYMCGEPIRADGTCGCDELARMR
jgi:hypothetical protein